MLLASEDSLIAGHWSSMGGVEIGASMEMRERIAVGSLVV